MKLKLVGRLKEREIKEQEDNIITLKDQQANSYNRTKVEELNAEASALQRDLRFKERELAKPIQLDDDPKLSQQLRIVNSQISEINGSLHAILGVNSTLLDRDDCPTCGANIPDSKKILLQVSIDDLKSNLKLLEEERLSIQKDIEEYKKNRKQEIKD